jgi:hypothetical protein
MPDDRPKEKSHQPAKGHPRPIEQEHPDKPAYKFALHLHVWIPPERFCVQIYDLAA